MKLFNSTLNMLPSDPQISSDLIDDLLQNRRVEDQKFDLIFPSEYRELSRVHWTPILVARQIAKWIGSAEKKSFIDIGCGTGKLCLLLRILSEHDIYGIDRRADLVDIANNIIVANSFQNIYVQQKNMLDLNWDDYDVFYFYNPFQEQLIQDPYNPIANDIVPNKRNYSLYTSEVFRQLTWMKPGKMLITFHGYGGKVPHSWRLIGRQEIYHGELGMWVKETS